MEGYCWEGQDYQSYSAIVLVIVVVVVEEEEGEEDLVNRFF